MPDYNIYIRAIGGGGVANQTTPWSQRESGGGDSQTTSQSGGASNFGGAANSIIRASAMVQNPDSIVGGAVGALAKAAPWVAAAYAVIKTCETIANEVIEVETIKSGDYGTQIKLNNIKNAMHIMTHPFSSSMQAYKAELQWRQNNKRLELERDLLGDSIINSYTRRGV